MAQKFLTINAIPEILERDRRTVKRALRNIPPDHEEHGSPRWKLSTAARALAAGSDGGVMEPTAVGALCDQIEKLAAELEANLQSARAESDVEKRRSAIARFGPKVGQLQQLMETAAAGTRPAEAGLLKIVRDQVIGACYLPMSGGRSAARL